MRLSIEVSPEQHKKLKASAALKGQSIKDYVLERALPSIDDETALKELEAFLQPRIESAEKGRFSSKSVDDIFTEAEENKS